MFFCFDFGIKKIGLSIGQQISKTVSLLKPFKINNGKINWLKIKYLLKFWNPISVVIGLPINNNKSLLLIFLILKFSIVFYKKFNVYIFFHNEYLSTIEAKKFFLIYKKKYKIKDIYIDSISSKLILKSWFIDNKY
ncbi:Holliday junction resolvase RuvX [Enterobacteriaceae bacterium ET-AT1-13]|nr:Holliday junction resolvase RuvX [Enterobacteriaceae bacterium ET-AT1-13]WGS66478.1 Holliday junction resolvase RuvX [Enterobacteriaceae bacterium Cmel17]WMC17503.1 MAG: Holliday junction resolvase RuvX [Enterobacteriaceae bacterium Cmel21]WMC17710.1 MAG: Holliday junction resolvase RuvX [Enterobacteriaceae bacterium PSmelAO3-2]WMC17914.1 MAG: Holliday junction resolvase RuvX [Enterobacteriaceae bacterium PSmelAO3-1]WMC18117.1 MAG: Holliday junction resolvase RuvX [Enterobacteriaceae bacter